MEKRAERGEKRKSRRAREEGSRSKVVYGYDEAGNISKAYGNYHEPNEDGGWTDREAEYRDYGFDYMLDFVKEVCCYYNADGSLINREETKFDDIGRMIEIALYDADDNLYERRVIEYDEAGNRTDTVYDAEGNITDTVTY